ncbi:MAG: NAD(P)/FAD-dependent oxidoreductase [Bryobacteraceae bacterium]|nr:NAD(P)/FAD-dependent oxidoreductase [Bryobacteraceae bacterium]
MSFDVVVIGAGAAGLFCAAHAARHGLRVALIEGNGEAGRKILISGGGRCNFTNRHTGPENFLSGNPHFCRSALARYTPADFVSLVEQHRIRWHEKKLGQLFCDGSAREIVDMLLRECADGGVALRTGCRVVDVSYGSGFAVSTTAESFEADAVVVATGGLSIPKIGATGVGYDIARKFGLKILAPGPALVPLVLKEEDRQQWCDLAGVAADVRATFGRQNFEERLLITHRGLSGPAVLQISSYWNGRDPVTFDLLPDQSLGLPGNRAWKTVLGTHLPRRLAERWLETYFEGTDQAPTGEVLETGLHSWTFLPEGTEGFAKAEVTAGGVCTSELSSKTMEARSVPGLYFIGEVVDVTGHLGGFNFQWAWASAFACAEALGHRLAPAGEQAHG